MIIKKFKLVCFEEVLDFELNYDILTLKIKKMTYIYKDVELVLLHEMKINSY